MGISSAVAALLVAVAAHALVVIPRIHELTLGEANAVGVAVRLEEYGLYCGGADRLELRAPLSFEDDQFVYVNMVWDPEGPEERYDIVSMDQSGGEMTGSSCVGGLPEQIRMGFGIARTELVTTIIEIREIDISEVDFVAWEEKTANLPEE